MAATAPPTTAPGSPGSDFEQATASYEAWLGRHMQLRELELRLKHEQMRADLFAFLRGTYYRWAQTWTNVRPELAEAPEVMAVGDLHVANFGLWRDGEGRLVWGVNDFDESYRLPYTNDLVRLAVSAVLTGRTANLAVCARDASAAILDGYRAWLKRGGRPFVLAEQNDWLHAQALKRLRDPDRFWKKLHALPDWQGEVPSDLRDALAASMPESNLPFRVAHRIAGVGSLGRPRLVAIGEAGGSSIAREGKALAPSACAWAAGDATREVEYERIVGSAVRCRDPHVHRAGRWIIRRLAPDCTRIDLESLPAREKTQVRLLRAMGAETANIHLGRPEAVDEIRRDLAARRGDWLMRSAIDLLRATRHDWKSYRLTAPVASQ